MKGKILLGTNKEEVAHLIYDLGRDQTKTFNIAYKELCRRLSIETDDESEEVFRKYRRTLTNLEKTADHFFAKIWKPSTPVHANDDSDSAFKWKYT